MVEYRRTTTNYIGETSRGAPNGVWWDPHTQIANNQPPASVITGSPGFGKTFLSETLACHSAIMGKTTTILDYKGDFLALKNLEDEIGPVNIWSLGGSGKPGILDPFFMSDKPEEQLKLTYNVIDIFLGGLSDMQSRALSPIIEDVIKDVNHTPSLAKVVDELRGSRREDARGMGATLNLIQKMPSSKVCFYPGKKRPKVASLDGGVTVATLLGLQLPADQEEARETREGRLASGILYLLTDFIRRVMSEQGDRPKTLIIDEAWSILSTPAGARTIKDIALLGRSKKLALILATQNYSHLDNVDIDNTIATHFAFNAEHAVANNVIDKIGLDSTEGFQNLVSKLDNGECLMRDWEKNYSTINVSDWRKDWAIAFKTNPFDS